MSFDCFRLAAAPAPLGLGDFDSGGGVKSASETFPGAEREPGGGTAAGNGSCEGDIFPDGETKLRNIRWDPPNQNSPNGHLVPFSPASGIGWEWS